MFENKIIKKIQNKIENILIYKLFKIFGIIFIFLTLNFFGIIFIFLKGLNLFTYNASTMCVYNLFNINLIILITGYRHHRPEPDLTDAADGTPVPHTAGIPPQEYTRVCRRTA